MPVLIETKLQVPPRRAVGVLRPRLVQRLQAGLHHAAKLTLVCAPAGYGKSSLVIDWLHTIAGERPPAEWVAWLALDERDDPVHFLTYLAAALHKLAPDDADRLQPYLNAPYLPDEETLAAALIHDVAAVGQWLASHPGAPQPGLLLVLDDYHKIHHPLIHTLLQRLIDHLPAHAHLILITRADPPLALPQLRVRGEMTEVRTQDLRFTVDEASDFFNQIMQLKLKPEWVDILAARTEGWIAGLHLAALSLQERAPEQAAGFIQAFRGSHRYVFDYLAEEVLNRQSADIRSFLIQTALLDRFCAPLCDAVTGRSDSRTLLVHLEQANLFLIPLDDERRWYRYHHLFADYLRTELTPAEEAAIAAKAAHWCESNDLVLEALHYGFVAHNPTLAADLLERLIQRAAAWSSGEMSALVSRVEALPTALLHSRPRLSLHASRAFYLAGNLTLAAQYLDQAEAALTAAPSSDGEALAGLAAVYRGALAAQQGQAEQAQELAQAGLARLPSSDLHARARAYDTLGLAHELAGELTQALDAYGRAAELAQAAGVSYLAINAQCEMALVYIAQGNLDQAEACCHQALRANDIIPPLGLARSILGEIARERNDLVSADQHLHAGTTLSRQGGLSEDLRWGLLFWVRLYQAQGNLPAAWAALAQLNALLQATGVPRLARLATAYTARLHLAAGQIEPVTGWAASYQAQSAAALPTAVADFEDLTLARYYLTVDALDLAQELLSVLGQAAHATGRLHTVLEAGILQARIAQARGDLPTAYTALGQAVRLAASLGFRRLFLDEGPLLATLLPAIRATAPAFADELVKALPLAKTLQAPAMPATMIEALSEQEGNVLRLLCAGLSNQEIAEQLVISRGTAKWHVHNILQKLTVSNRAQAIVRARELGLA